MSELIEKVKQFAVKESCGCWRWIGARQSKGQTPAMSWQGKCGNVRRFILLESGVPMGGYLASVSCGNQLCVNPAHVVRKTRAQVVIEAVASMDQGARTLRAMRTAHAIRARGTRLSMEVADAIREDQRPQRTIAAQYGVSQRTVQSIKKGVMWRDYSASSNPFVQLMR